MPHLTTDDGVGLYYEESGSGEPIVFVHEFAGDIRSWEPQVRHFSRLYRCIAFNARGYPPSDVPEEVGRYSQDRARDDIHAVLDFLGIAQAHIVGLSMGAFATLHFGMRYPERALSLTIAGGGYGAHPELLAPFRADALASAQMIRDLGMAHFSAVYGHGPTRVQLRDKDPRGFAEFMRILAEHSATGSANTMAGCQGRRPSLFALTDEMERLDVPTLIMAGDEDVPCLEACLLMKRCIPGSGWRCSRGAGMRSTSRSPRFSINRSRSSCMASTRDTGLRAMWARDLHRSGGRTGNPEIHSPRRGHRGESRSKA